MNLQQYNQFIMHHWELMLALVIILVLILINEWVNQRKRAKTLSTSAAIEWMNHHQAAKERRRADEQPGATRCKRGPADDRRAEQIQPIAPELRFPEIGHQRAKIRVHDGQ